MPLLYHYFLCLLEELITGSVLQFEKWVIIDYGWHSRPDPTSLIKNISMLVSRLSFNLKMHRSYQSDLREVMQESLCIDLKSKFSLNSYPRLQVLVSLFYYQKPFLILWSSIFLVTKTVHILSRILIKKAAKVS